MTENVEVYKILEMEKFIIVADDFGLSLNINRGIEIGAGAGALSFASLMVDEEFVTDAVKIAENNPGLTVGLHVSVSKLLNIDEDVWRGVRRKDLIKLISNRSLIKAVSNDCQRQISKFFDLGFAPTFINTHFNHHILPPFFEDFADIAAAHNFKYIRFSTKTPLLTHPDIPIEEKLPSMGKVLREKGIAFSDEYIAASFHFFPPELKHEFTEIMVHPTDAPDPKGGPNAMIYYLDLIKLLSWGDYYKYLGYEEGYEGLTSNGESK